MAPVCCMSRPKNGDFKNHPTNTPTHGYISRFPGELFKKILSLRLSRINQAHLFRLTASYLKEMRKGGYAPGAYLQPISKEYLLSTVGDHFYKSQWSKIHFNPENKNSIGLEDALFITDGDFIPDVSPLHFKIPQKYFSKDLIEVEVSWRKGTEPLNVLFAEAVEHHLGTMKRVTINLPHLNKNIREEVSILPLLINNDYCIITKNSTEFLKNYFLKSFPVDFVSEYYHKGRWNKFKCNVKMLKSTLEKERLNYPKKERNNVRIIKDGKRIEIGSVYEYCERRRERAIRSANDRVNLEGILMEQPLISSTNGRLTSPMTSFPNFVIKYCKIDGENIISLDLKSSQVIILANLMMKPESLIASLRNSKYPPLKKYLRVFLKLEFDLNRISDFIRYLQEQDIYKDIADHLKITRDAAKPEILRILFSGPGYNPKKYDVKKQFPEFFSNLKVIKEEFENSFGSSAKSLARFLQFVEAHIFIENIYSKFAKQNIYSFTKHDSVLVQESKKFEALKIIENTFEELQISGQIKNSELNIKDWEDNPFCTGPHDEFNQSGLSYELPLILHL
jgi:hypothetical protein